VTHSSPPHAAAPAVEAIDLVKKIGDTVAVDGISFSVPTGSVLGVPGPDGAGKTTTVRMLTTMSRPILVGRSISSLIHSSIGITVMALTGLAIGWRMREGFLDGSTFRSVEGVQGFMFTATYPLQHPVPFTICWALLITAVMAPLAIRAFRERAKD
jgi:energy-coupling factor transporter ATP-binding protein EcfA2